MVGKAVPPVLLAVSLLLISLNAKAQELKAPLNSPWEFRLLGHGAWYPATVPGTVHTDLHAAGLIPDPYWGDNMAGVQWVENEDWEYRAMVHITPEMLDHQHLDLVFHGLDTYAEVLLNGTPIGEADNMFRRWRWSIREQVEPGDHELRVVFRSPITKGMAMRKDHGVQLPHDSDPSGVAPYIRKAAYHFGWDFAPRAVTCGIWLPVELHAYDLSIDHLNVQQVLHEDRLKVKVKVSATTLGKPCDGAVTRLELRLNGAVMDARTGEGIMIDATELGFELVDPMLWWPRGSGSHPMQVLALEVQCNGHTRTIREERIAWRSVELDQREDSIGTAFTIVVNNQPTFMKGANVVPPHMFLPSAGDEAWVALVRDAAEANMNMLRVWGGGVYPPDAFFAACDTAGILVWQDFMFAYPQALSPKQRANIALEAKEQVDRMKNHPSLALFCGNNELEVAWNNWGWQSTYKLHGPDSARVWADQLELFEGALLAGPAQRAAIPYVHTSPLSNWGNERGLRHGSLHYWGVWHADSSFAAYSTNVGRFVSEYGFQSWPDSTILVKYIPGHDLFPGSSALGTRQRSYRGDRPILLAMERELGEVPTRLADYCTASQELQAMAYTQAIQAHRDATPICMGSLLWQLNEPWPGASWSIISFGGQRKAAYHAVKRAFEAP
ncbi:MAG: glycoside hydrolase family 2 protein [Flavobacteriales bacterium]|nr:glycoside hydrolase family 2 protein [Flavobacteriales bacterium]